MNKNLFTILKELKNIQPDAQYSKHSLDLIFLLKENKQPKFVYADAFNWIKLHRLSATIGSFGILAIFAFVIVSYLPGNKNGLVAEANEINSSIQIRLDEIQYQLNNQPISTSTAIHTQNSLNEAAKNLLNAFETSSNPEKLEDVVNNIKEAKDIIAELNSRLKDNNQ